MKSLQMLINLFPLRTCIEISLTPRSTDKVYIQAAKMCESSLSTTDHWDGGAKCGFLHTWDSHSLLSITLIFARPLLHKGKEKYWDERRLGPSMVWWIHTPVCSRKCLMPAALWLQKWLESVSEDIKVLLRERKDFSFWIHTQMGSQLWQRPCCYKRK